MSRASERAYSKIRAMILSGELLAGSPLREEQLAMICGVSRTPVRDAMRRLEAEMFINRSESQRSFVMDWSLDDVEDAFILRGMLEGLAARRAAMHISSEQLAYLKAENRMIFDAINLSSPNIPFFLRHNRNFHATVIDAANSPRITNLLAGIIEQPVVWRTAQHYDRENLLRSHREHDELINAFVRQDGAWAEAVMTGHIRRAFHTYADAHLTQRKQFEVAAE